MAFKTPDVFFGDLIERYQAGESILAASKRLGISRTAITGYLRRAGVALRSASEAELLRWSQMSAEQRACQVAKAHHASRGRIAGAAELHLKAAVRARNPIGSAYELRLRRLLAERGIETIHQLAVGPYNCDLAAYPVAVEIFGGNWHWSGRHILRTPKRVRHFLNAGWHVLIVWCGKVDQRLVEIGADVADYVCSYIQSARRDPTAVREYRVIQGAGDLWACGSADDSDKTIEMSLRRREGPARKRYRR